VPFQTVGFEKSVLVFG